ncbi:MAG: phosphatase PAP2 family protein [Gemmatimonadaceae bacterium]|nr:phosphatase PAP2 family protein [Chitinophagaceae bacterium]
MRQFLKRRLANLSLRFLLSSVIFIASVIFFVLITRSVLGPEQHRMDIAAIKAFAKETTTTLRDIMIGISFLASSPFLTVAYLLLLGWYSFFHKSWRRGLATAIIGIGGSLVTHFLKVYFQRPRPANPLSDPLLTYSFPSGHSSAGFIFYGLLIYLVSKSNLSPGYKILTGILLAALSLLIGLSRIILRFHYLSDVIGGFCIGAAWLSLSIYLLEHYPVSSSNPKTNSSRK